MKLVEIRILIWFLGFIYWTKKWTFANDPWKQTLYQDWLYLYFNIGMLIYIFESIYIYIYIFYRGFVHLPPHTNIHIYLSLTLTFVPLSYPCPPKPQYHRLGCYSRNGRAHRGALSRSFIYVSVPFVAYANYEGYPVINYIIDHRGVLIHIYAQRELKNDWQTLRIHIKHCGRV